MYAPTQSEDYNEWIEIYNDEDHEIRISNLTICNNNILEGFINHSNGLGYLQNIDTIPPNSFAIITDGGSGTEAYDNFDIAENSVSLHTSGATICGGLANEDKLIILNNNEEPEDALHYYSNWGARDNGKTLCKLDNLWKECTPTPGYQNSQENTIHNYTLKINEFLPNPEGYDNAPMPKGEWIELFNYGTKELDLTNATIRDNTLNRKLIISNTNTYTQLIKPKEYLVVYLNGAYSGFLNNDEDIEKIILFSPEDIELDRVTYTDTKEGESWSKVDNVWRLTKPTPGEENPDDSEKVKDSIISIEKLYLGSDNKAKFGDNIRVKLNIYKGNATKEMVEMYILSEEGSKLTKTTKTNLGSKYTTYDITLPLQILPNCNLNYPNKNYTIIVKGLDAENKIEIPINGTTDKLCEIIQDKCTEEEVVALMEKTGVETVINLSKDITGEVIYESTSKKAQRSAIYFFCLILILVIIQMVIENGKNKD